MTSPLGGQAILRLLNHTRPIVTDTIPLKFLDTTTFNSSNANGGSAGASTLKDIQTLFLSSLTAPMSIQNSSRDLWGNPKLPAADISQEDWNLVATNNQQYLSLIGIPVGNLSSESSVRTNFTVDSVSAVFICSSVFNTTLSDFNAKMKDVVLGGPDQNITYQGTILGGMSTSFMVVTNESWTEFIQNTSIPMSIFYGVQLPDTASNISVAECSLEMLRLQAHLTCIGQACAVTAVQPKPSNLADDYVNNLEMLLARGQFCGMGLSSHALERSSTHSFLLEPSKTIGTSGGGIVLGNIPIRELEYRLTLAYNTFLYAANPLVYTQPLTSMTSYGTPAPNLGDVTAIEIRTLGQVYQCRWHWFVIGLAVTVLLEAIAVANLILGWRTVVPDVLGYVSSMTVDNTHCVKSLKAESSAIDGLSRARKLGSTRFMLGDVRPESEVGRIALVPVGIKGNASCGRVRLKRAYD